jgi:hypothetical protein
MYWALLFNDEDSIDDGNKGYATDDVIEAAVIAKRWGQHV